MERWSIGLEKMRSAEWGEDWNVIGEALSDSFCGRKEQVAGAGGCDYTSRR